MDNENTQPFPEGTQHIVEPPKNEISKDFIAPSGLQNDKIAKKSSPVLTIILVLLLLLSLGSTGYFAYQNMMLQKQIAGVKKEAMMVASPTPTSMAYYSPTPSASADPTAGWKTYTNTKYDFVIKYPLDWHVDDFSSTASSLGFVKNGQQSQQAVSSIRVLID